jgi:phosphoglucomutase
MNLSPLAGKPPPPSLIADIPRLVTDFFSLVPDPDNPAQRVSFGTSGHRGTSLAGSFNENHILAITQAVCLFRSARGIRGPLFVGADTHALSRPAFVTAVSVLAANGITTIVSDKDEPTPTPAVSHAILTYNRPKDGLAPPSPADGIVITPSHNPPEDGGFKYNPPTGGPADPEITRWIEETANRILKEGLREVRRLSFERAIISSTVHTRDYLSAYVSDLGEVIDMELLRSSGIRIGVDPLGGAGVHYWGRIAEEYGLNLTVVRETIDPTFSFMTVDWDGKIRMDPSSPWAMKSLVALKDRFDIAFGCDTDHDRHGIVSPTAGLMNPNHYLSALIFYLFSHRPEWKPEVRIGKTLVSSRMIDRVAKGLGRTLVEVPVGFKWFVEGLLDGSMGFGGEESAGASFLRRNGRVWTTDKDALVPSLCAAEMTAKTGKDPGTIYQDLTDRFGTFFYRRIDSPATPAEKSRLSRMTAESFRATTLAGDRIERILTTAPGNGQPIGGIKVETEHGWFSARPSGTEAVAKIYAESDRSEEHLEEILREAEVQTKKALFP